MSTYRVSDTDLTSVANAIRTKGGTSEQLEFPTDFVSAISAISTGSSEMTLLASGTYTLVNEGDLTIPVEYTGKPCLIYVYVPEILASTNQLFQAIAYIGDIPETLDGSVWQNGFGLRRIQTNVNQKQFPAPSSALSGISLSSSALTVTNGASFPNRANTYNWYIWGYSE